MNDPRGKIGDMSCSMSDKWKAVTGRVGEPIFPVLLSGETKKNSKEGGIHPYKHAHKPLHNANKTITRAVTSFFFSS